MSMNSNVFNLVSFIVTANEDVSSLIALGFCGLFSLSLVFIIAHWISNSWVNDKENSNELENII